MRRTGRARSAREAVTTSEFQAGERAPVSQRARAPEPGPNVVPRPEAVGYAVLEQAASYDESITDWRTA
jgi:hypothetical protein